jgi:hypothetical protein
MRCAHIYIYISLSNISRWSWHNINEGLRLHGIWKEAEMMMHDEAVGVEEEEARY